MIIHNCTTKIKASNMGDFFMFCDIFMEITIKIFESNNQNDYLYGVFIK